MTRITGATHFPRADPGSQIYLLPTEKTMAHYDDDNMFQIAHEVGQATLSQYERGQDAESKITSDHRFWVAQAILSTPGGADEWDRVRWPVRGAMVRRVLKGLGVYDYE